jgi:uncharacterized membrane protein YagU involved in acid resistance
MTAPSASRFAAGIRVGVVAAAATVGAVIGLGIRHGLALRPFIAPGRGVIEALGLEALGLDVASTRATAVVGVAFVALAIIVLGLCFTLVAATLRGVALLVAAIAFGALAWAASVYVVPSVLALTTDTVLGTAQRVFVCGMLALALVAGMRLARPDVDARIE